MFKLTGEIKKIIPVEGNFMKLFDFSRGRSTSAHISTRDQMCAPGRHSRKYGTDRGGESIANHRNHDVCLFVCSTAVDRPCACVCKRGLCMSEWLLSVVRMDHVTAVHPTIHTFDRSTPHTVLNAIVYIHTG